MDKRKDPSSVDIKSILLDMRKYRMGLIQTPDQLRFSYMAVLEVAKSIMKDSSVQVCVCASQVDVGRLSLRRQSGWSKTCRWLVVGGAV